MNKPEGYDQEQAFTGDYKSVTPGGHICKIQGARIETTRDGADILVVAFDIVEGPCANFYTEQFDRAIIGNKDAKWQGTYRQFVDGSGLKFFKGMITAIENSNSGYKWNWDEKTLKGKLFGGVFGQEEWLNKEGKIKLSTKCRFIRSVEQIRKGVDVPEIKRLQGANQFGHDVKPDDTDINF